MRTASALTCRARPGEKDGTSSPGPVSPGRDHTWLSAGSQGSTAVASLAPKGHWTCPPASSPALRMPPGAAGRESPHSLPVDGQGPEGSGLCSASRCESCSLLIFRQTAEPLPAEAAPPAREPPPWGEGSRHLKAQCRQSSRPPWMVGGSGVSSSSPGSESAAPPLQVSVRSWRPVPLCGQCRRRRRPCTRSPQSRRPSTRSPPWWVP